jgi:antitoxin component HigA of HigAB toxin-antitoxin module
MAAITSRSVNRTVLPRAQPELKQADLKSSGYVSDVVNGKRVISKTHARELAAFFKVCVDLFV